jgi:acyl-CoA thioesterase FadM
MSAFPSSPANITIRRRIEWVDTDAAAIYHWTTVMRLAEAAEAALHTALEIASRTFGVTPRVSVAFEFHHPLRFNDLVDVSLAVESVGTASLTQRVSLLHDERVCAEGRMVMCHVDRASGQPLPWPDDMRALFTNGGRRREGAV